METYEEKIQKLINRLRNLPQNKNKSNDELRKQAEKQIQKKEIELQFSGLKDEEAKKATLLYNKYISETFFESLAERSSLINLVYLEILKERLQREISESGTVPMGLTEKLIDLDEQIIKTKEKLGMLKEGEELTFEQKWNDLEEKCLKYYEEHAAEFYTKCIAEGSKILMADFTTKNIEDLEIGEEIMAFDKNGWNRLQKAKILNKIYNGEKKVIEIDTGINTLSLTPDHLILVDYVGHYERNWQRVGDEIIGVTLTSRHKIPTFKYLITNIEDYYKGCLLGMIDSDGSVIKPKHLKWNFSTKFIIWQSKIKEYRAIEFILEYLNILYTKKEELGNRSGFNKEYQGYKYYISTKNSDFILKIKEQINYNRNIQLGYLTGFVLGDGNINKTGRISIAQKIGIKSDYLENIIKILELKFKKYLCKNGMNIFNIFSGQIPFHCPNSIKTKKYSDLISSIYRKAVPLVNFKLKSIKENIKVWDLTTTTETFIANGFYVHNCPYCSKIFPEILPPEKLEPKVAVWFKNTTLYNQEVFELYHQKKITIEQAARIMGVGKNYIELQYNEIFLKEKNDK